MSNEIEPVYPSDESSLTSKFGVPHEILDDPKKFDKQLPQLRRTVAFVRQYELARPKGKQNLLSSLAQNIIRDPTILEHVLTNLDLMDQIQPTSDISHIRNKIIESVEKEVGNRRNLPTWTPTEIEQLMNLGVTQPGELRSAFEKMASALFNAPQTMEEAVDLHYNAAWAMVSTSSLEIKEEVFSILCLEKPWFNGHISVSAWCFNSALFAPNDHYLGQYHAILDAMNLVGRLLEANAGDAPATQHARRVLEREQQLAAAQKDRTTEVDRKAIEISARNVRQNPDRFLALAESYFAEDDNPPALYFGSSYLETADIIRKKKTRVDNFKWPDSVMGDLSEPLRRMAFKLIGPHIFKSQWEQMKCNFAQTGGENLTTHSILLTDDMKIEIVAWNCETDEERQAIVREVCSTIRSGRQSNPSRKLAAPMDKILDTNRNLLSFGFTQPFDQEGRIVFAIYRADSEEIVGQLSSIIEYHRPSISQGQISQINNEITRLRQELRTSFTRSVGKRGYQLVVSDPILRQFGYQTIEFKLKPDTNLLQVKLKISDIFYTFFLDQNYEIPMQGDIKRFQSLQDMVWVEILTLGHLKKIICTEESNIEHELLGKEKQLSTYRKQTINRIEHLRRLPVGMCFSQEAFLNCLNSSLPVRNLLSINQMRTSIGLGGTPATGMWTYVKPVEKPIDTQQVRPIKIAFSNATEDMRKVIDLGKVSDEELARIEKEIFSELEAV